MAHGGDIINQEKQAKNRYNSYFVHACAVPVLLSVCLSLCMNGTDN